MLAVTVWQPWASLIVGSPPTEGCPGAPPQMSIENRDKRPWRTAVGQRIAIHAGKHMDRDTLDTYSEIFKESMYGSVVAPYATPKAFPRGAIVGVATIERVIGPIEPSIFYETRLDDVPAATISSWGLDTDDLRWFTGPFGWVLSARQHLAEPVTCSGSQGFWQLSPEVERAVTAQIARAA